MNKLGVAIVIGLFLMGFVAAVTINPTGYTTNNNSEQDNESDSSEENDGNGQLNSSSKEDDDSEDELNETEDECEEWSCTKWSNCTKNMKTRDCVQMNNSCPGKEIPNLTKRCEEKEELKLHNRITRCPEECICTGSTIKCKLASGREMIVVAGKSGNMIVQIKGINMSTNVRLYKGENGTLYGMFKGKEKRIKLLPDQIKERIKERIKARLENESITLNENGTYDYDGEKKAKLFFVIPVNVEVQAKIDPETGKVLEIKNPWWSFLAKDDNEEQIVGASCGTVTPGQNDACCQNKNYDLWNITAAECQFNSSQ